MKINLKEHQDFILDYLINMEGSFNTYFLLGKRRRAKFDLNYFLDKINIDEYNIYKASSKIGRCTIEDLYNMKYSRFLLVRKELDINNFDEWVEFIYKIAKFNMTYLNRPFPNIDTKKIKIIEWQTLKNQTN